MGDACTRCGGHGRVTYRKKDGQIITIVCPTCRGSGGRRPW